MTDKSQELALAVLREAKANGTLDKSIEAELAELIGAKARPELEEVLENEGSKPADIVELVKKLELEAQYGECLKTLQHYGFLTENGEVKEGDTPTPSFEKAMSTFKPEELEIASNFQKPTLLLIPETSFEAKVKAMDAHKQGIQKADTYVNEIYSKTDSGSDKITGWRAVIVDGAQKMETYEGDKLDLIFDKRIEARKAARKESEKGMDRHRYALFMMEAIRNGNPVDKELCTLLDDDPALSACYASYVPHASFHPGDRRVDFSRNDPGSDNVRARFRSSVGGDVLIS